MYDILLCLEVDLVLSDILYKNISPTTRKPNTTCLPFTKQTLRAGSKNCLINFTWLVYRYYEGYAAMDYVSKGV